MNFQLRSNYTNSPEQVVSVEPEEIARQIVGSRITFHYCHDITFQFVNGSVTLDDIDLIICIIPHQFYCYRGDDLVTTVVLESNNVDIDLRNPGNGANRRAFFRAT